ncbi:MAG TPA: aldehyde dehydrogenase (NADP(+)) [Acidimicrobiales bacterium]|nr:aldehyde dehydrogenase (NADP(+)) [Acidimicrobiales bacterium]
MKAAGEGVPWELLGCPPLAPGSAVPSLAMIQSRDARSGQVLNDVAEETNADQLDTVCREAAEAFAELEQAGRHGRADMLAAMADALEEDRDEIVACADRESALGTARLNGELTRTCFQLRFFTEVLSDGAYLEATIDHAGPTPMGPRPDLRRMLRPLGPVGVFGASNFPLAFSVPGGDTASALAAGCPVVVKVHNAHPATSVLCARALAEGERRAGVRGQVVSLVFGDRSSAALVEHPAVRAVGFTGSLVGGRFLSDVAAKRPSPIPFYGELGALNPVVVGPQAARLRGEAIADGLAGSFTLGVGQFCTKPGLLLLPEGEAGDALRDRLSEAVRATSAGAMLSDRVAGAFQEGSQHLRHLDGVRVLAEGGLGRDGLAFPGAPLLLQAEPDALGGRLREECFGPVLVIVRYAGVDDLSRLVSTLTPALTATVQADGADISLLRPVVSQLSSQAGRIVWNGYPTGVAVAWAMQHGGPYPAATDPLHTSVGASAIRRWLRPVTYQDVPAELLPPELGDVPQPRDAVPRRVDGHLVLPPGYQGA